MSERGWAGSIVVAIAAAGGAGAAQLGLGYGLGIITWQPAGDGAGEAAWIASLAWATWVAATSAVGGAIVADRLSGVGADRGGAEPALTLTVRLWRVALAVAAAVGALLTVALIAVPARGAQRADTFSPQTIAAGYAVVGVIVGLLVAVGALAVRAVAVNVLATTGVMWTLAVAAVVDSAVSGTGPGPAQLGVWRYTDDSPGYWFHTMYLPGAAVTLGSALLIGAGTAWWVGRRTERGVAVAMSGAAGPLLVAAAYFLAAPRPLGVRPDQLSAYLLAPYGVLAGLAGSVLGTALAARTRTPRAGDPPRAAEPGAAEHASPPEPATPATPPASPVGTAAPAGPGAPAGGAAAGVPAGDPARPDLADDGYAPARAYAPEPAAEPDDPPAAERGAARGQAAVTMPLWPERPTGAPTARRRRGRGGS